MLQHLIPPHLRLAASIAGAGALFAAGAAAAIALEHKAPWGLEAKRLAALADAADWQGAAETWESTARGWEASFRGSEGLRREEQRVATAAVEAAQGACDARVAAARKSALALSAIVNKETAHDAQGCAVRQLVDPRELRDAVGAGGPAAR